MSQEPAGTTDFGTTLVRARHTPIRFAMATLVGSSRFWGSYALGAPIVTLVIAFLVPLFAPIAAVVPFVISLLLLWLSHEFIHTEIDVNSETGTLTISNAYGAGTSSPIDVDEIAHVSVIRIGHAGLVNISYEGKAYSKPIATAIDRTDIAGFKSQLRRLGVEASVNDTVPPTMWARVIVTPVIILGSLATIWFAFGADAFRSNAVVLTTILLAGLTARSFWLRHLRSGALSIGSRMGLNVTSLCRFGAYGQLLTIALAALFWYLGMASGFYVAAGSYLLTTTGGIVGIAKSESIILGPLILPLILPGFVPLYYFTTRQR